MSVACDYKMKDEFFAVDSLKKSFADKKIFSSASCSFASNGLYLLFGENGSGKSTLLNILSGKDGQWEGNLSFCGKPILKKNRELFTDEYVSYVAQDSLVFEDESVIDDFLLPYGKKDRKKAQEILSHLGLGAVLDEKCSELSEGEKERLCFGQAIYAGKRIILLDEITANLDPQSAEMILKHVLTLSQNHLVIFATHENLPEWFIEKANVLHRKEGKIIACNSMLQSEHTDSSDIENKKESFFSEFLLSRKKNKETHWFIECLCCILSFFCVLLMSFYGSFKDTVQIGADGSVTTIYASERISKKVFAETSPIFISRKKNNDFYSVLDLNYYSIRKDEDYRKAGSLFAGVFEFDANDVDKPALIEGTYPIGLGDAIVSDVCFSSLSGFAIGQKINFGKTEYKIVGIYKARDPASLEHRYSEYPVKDKAISLNKNVRICYSFMTESVFAIGGNPGTDFYALKSTKQNRETFLNDSLMDSDISIESVYRYQYAPVCVDKNGKENLTFFRSYLFNLIFGILSAVILLIFLFIFAFSFDIKNKRKYILLRYRGTSRKRLIKSDLLTFGFSTFLGISAGIGISELTLLIRNGVYGKALGVDSLILFFSFNYSILLLLGIYLVFRILFFAVLNLLCPKDMSRLIAEVKKKA